MRISDFAIPFFDELKRKNLRYAVCGNYQKLPHETEHDIDLWAENPQELKLALFEVAKKRGYRLFLINETANGFNSVFYGKGKESQFIKVDVLSELAVFSSVVLVPSSLIGTRTITHNGISVVDNTLENVMNLLYAVVARGKVKPLYRQNIRASLMAEEAEFTGLLDSSIGSGLAADIIQYVRDDDWDSLEARKNIYLKKMVWSQFLNPTSGLWLRVPLMGLSILRRKLKKNGLMLEFIGIDGAGKTTIIDVLYQDLLFILKKEKIYRGYWRPYFLPPIRSITSKITGTPDSFFAESQTNNRILEQRIRNKEGSLVRKAAYLAKFFYYWLDFLIGPSFVYNGIWSRGGVVLYDRGYVDMELMPERFEFSLPRGVMRFFRNFIPKPNFVFFLWAPPKVIHLRKKEFDEKDILTQVKQYRSLRNSISNFIDIDTSGDIANVKEKVLDTICDYQEKRWVS